APSSQELEPPANPARFKTAYQFPSAPAAFRGIGSFSQLNTDRPSNVGEAGTLGCPQAWM
ncbi:MAG TPA: hypothetical protein VIH58_13010, partial [Chthoniobacterales bacterium]